MDLRIYNSLSRELETFVPQRTDQVSMYCCGPTVYSYAHIGNARPPVLFGLLARVLKHRFGKDHVKYLRNITDVDDKINAAAAQLVDPGLDINQKIARITEQFTRIYQDDMRALGADQPDLEPRVTTHLSDIITMCEMLIASGHAYAAEGHVLFNIETFDDYGKLSGRSVKEMIAGARVEVAPFKKHPADFVLWKPSSDDLPGWPSPWGRGRPGWHIECSAMIRRHVGETLDLHCGGNDLLFPHHENEIAQSTCAHGGRTFARYWMHNGMVTVDGRKMSKSLGNTLLVSDVRAKFDTEVVRFWMLGGHYRQPLDWSDAALQQAKSTLDRIYGAIQRLEAVAVAEHECQPSEALLAALCDDLNTPQALAELSALARDANKAEGNEALSAAKRRLLGSTNFLGLCQRPAEQWFRAANPAHAASASIDDAAIEARVAERQAARKARDFARSDAIRDELAALGVVLEDTAGGVRWKRS